MAALAKDPAQRWQSAEEFAAALEAARAQIEPGAPARRTRPRSRRCRCATPAAPPSARRPATRPTSAEQRRRWPWFTIGCSTLALVGAS